MSAKAVVSKTTAELLPASINHYFGKPVRAASKLEPELRAAQMRLLRAVSDTLLVIDTWRRARFWEFTI